MQDVRCEMRDSQCEIQDMRCEIQDSHVSYPTPYIKHHISNIIHHISFSKYLKIAIILIISTLSINAQITTKLNQADYDAKKIKFGYFLGLPVTHLNLEFNNYYVAKDPAYSISSPNTIGLKMGGLMNVSISDYFDFRFQPTISIYSRVMQFKYATIPTGFQESTKRETAWFEIPVLIKYKSERRGNVRMYVFAGVCLGLETNAVNRKDSRQFAQNTTDFSIQYGTGIEIFKEYFKFAPELHFSHGIVNLANPAFSTNNNLAGISKMTSHTVTLCVLFE